MPVIVSAHGVGSGEVLWTAAVSLAVFFIWARAWIAASNRVVKNKLELFITNPRPRPAPGAAVAFSSFAGIGPGSRINGQAQGEALPTGDGIAREV